ncbi:hypothetical protein LTS18_005792, partial [Coniosporium uncinatum]
VWDALPPSPPSPPPFIFPPLSSSSANLTSDAGGTVWRVSLPLKSPPHARQPSTDRYLSSLGFASDEDSASSRGRPRTREIRRRSRGQGRKHSPAGLRTGNVDRKTSRHPAQISSDWQDEDAANLEERRPSAEQYQLLTDQYRELAARPKTQFVSNGVRSPSTDLDSETDGRDIKLVPAPLFFEERTKSQCSGHTQIRLGRDYGEDAYGNVRSDSKKKKGKASSLSSLSGKMGLPTHLKRHSSVHGEIPISPSLPDEEYAVPTAETLTKLEHAAWNSARFSAFYPKKRSTSSSRLRVRKPKSMSREETKTPLADNPPTTLPPPSRSKTGPGATKVHGEFPIDPATDTKDFASNGTRNKLKTSRDDHRQPPEPNQGASANTSGSGTPLLPHEPGYRKPAETAILPHHKPSSSESSSITKLKPATGPLHSVVDEARASVASAKTTWPKFDDRAPSGSSHGTASDQDVQQRWREGQAVGTRGRGEEKGKEVRRHTSFLSKAVGARKEKERERKGEELKRSIRVVGQVDPRSVESSEDTMRRMAYAERAGEKGSGGHGGKRDTFGAEWV